ncbi:peptide chain release factor 2 [Natranaerovirga hydrolytica]|uniref:Peptide chain release factor 2 n=1 Tax=Natranaerovirga hydrolytica TaxID=680378 RepID=A0A4R1MD41_9FIRM|nr:peptide chain release factor 2 [Natranaerovirga hydrolytica]TCK87949.1 peptide chain release factor 2 [Natranaerovirga hydrolytica]
MLELEQLQTTLNEYKEPLEEMRESLDLESKRDLIKALEKESSAPEFWSDQENSQKVLKKIKALKDEVGAYETLINAYEDVETLIEMGIEEQDEDLILEVKEHLKTFINNYESLRIQTLLSGEYDFKNAIVSLHAGAGGTESCDWANMLLRMYTRWAEKRGYSVEMLDYLDGDEAGVKSVTIQINGENAYGYLKSEKGVHRLVRISPFDSSGRRHTSFASCDVLPEIDDDDNIEINPEEIRIDTYRASGAGGQHVNTTDSAIRITHLPTNTVVQCQNERSQHKNKDRALKMLKAKLFEIKQQENMSKLEGIRGEVKEIGWGSQIRSYVMHPYNMVKDHRTNTETGNVSSVMDGNIDLFINEYLKWLNKN